MKCSPVLIDTVIFSHSKLSPAASYFFHSFPTISCIVTELEYVISSRNDVSMIDIFFLSDKLPLV